MTVPTIPSDRYTSVAIILHWVMAIAFCLMLGSGVAMKYGSLSQILTFQMYQWHKSLGVLLLGAFVIRILWRLFHKPPALQHMRRFEVFAAHAGHWLLYACMVALPLSGWVMVSSSVYGLPTIVFGWFEWPHIPRIAGNETMEHFAKLSHLVLAIGFALLILGHVSAVVKHAVVDHDNLLKRMWWTHRSQQEKS